MTTPTSSLEGTKEEVERLCGQLRLSRSQDEALEIAIKAAERSMQALKLTRDPAEQSDLSKKVSSLLKQAEQIKTRPDWRSVVSVSPAAGENGPQLTSSRSRSAQLAEPKSSRVLTRKEQILVLKASFLHGFKFPPWESVPSPEEFQLEQGEAQFLDTNILPLSELQEDVLDDWRRAPDALPPPSWRALDRTLHQPTMDAGHGIDLIQDAATDCSVVSSLCASVARLHRGFPRMSKTLLCPYDPEREMPIMSKNGKYIARLNFNGCFRKVVIDDRLPTSSTARVIHVVDRGNPGLLWPALIEKAYLKVRGGYDFPGSNSGTDLWILTGWIPEQVFVQCDDLEIGRFWQRIFNGFQYGDVVITMGTGKMGEKTERELGLAGEHDYAVLDLREVDGQRLMLVKNPWCEGTSWRGKTALLQGSEVSESILMLSTTNVFKPDEPVQNPRDLLNSDDHLSPGTFWMDIENVMQHFESIYLNWNPGLFRFREDLHFSWDLATTDAGLKIPRGRFASLSRHPQFNVSSQNGGIIWIVLCRHFQNSVPADATPEEIEADRYGVELSGHMSLLTFSSRGKRVLLPDRATEKGWFVDSPQTLLKLTDCIANERYTMVPAEQELPTINHTFTISAFSNSPLMLEDAAVRFSYTRRLSGAWTKHTAGGNAHSPMYSTNPQFSVIVARRTQMSLLLEAVNDELNIHVKLVHGQGERVHAVRNRDIVFDSKDYRRGCCVAECDALEPGKYTIICSTFEQHQQGEFTLLVETSEPITVNLLPREGAGRVRLEIDPAIFLPGQTRLAISLVPYRLTKFYAIARFLGSRSLDERPSTSSRSPLRMSIEVGRMPLTRQIASSEGGEYADSVGGIRLDEIDLGPEMRRNGDVWLVLDRMVAAPVGQEERLSVELFVDQLNALVCGDWMICED